MEAVPKFLAIPEASHACRHSKALRSRGPSMRQQRLTGDVAAGLSARLLPAGAVRGAQQRCRRAGLGRSGALRHRLRRVCSPERRGAAMCRATDPSRPGAALCREDALGEARLARGKPCSLVLRGLSVSLPAGAACGAQCPLL